MRLRREDGAVAAAMGLSLAVAFHDEPNMTYILGHRRHRLPALTWFFGSFVAELGFRYGVVDATPSGEGGAIWFAPGQSPSMLGSVAAGLLTMPLHFGFAGTRRSAELGGRVDRVRNEVVPGDHWYLAALGVTPDHQGEGIGGELMAPVLDRADREQTACYLETFRLPTTRFYRRFGFSVVHEDAAADHVPFWCMLREPGNRGRPEVSD